MICSKLVIVKPNNPPPRSKHNDDSGSGWPSFYKTAREDAVKTIEDKGHGMVRTEVVCDKVSLVYK